MDIRPPFELLNIIDSNIILINPQQIVGMISLKKNVYVDFCLKIECGYIKESFEIAKTSS
jgi:hypothetical protein